MLFSVIFLSVKFLSVVFLSCFFLSCIFSAPHIHVATDWKEVPRDTCFWTPIVQLIRFTRPYPISGSQHSLVPPINCFCPVQSRRYLITMKQLALFTHADGSRVSIAIIRVCISVCVILSVCVKNRNG